MLSTILLVLETIKNVAYFSIYLSINTGKLIVSGVLAICNILNKTVHTLWTLCVILNEDLLVFLSDLCSRICVLCGACNTLAEYLGEFMFGIFSVIRNVTLGAGSIITGTIDNVLDVIVKLSAGFANLITNIKHLVVLFGSGVWFVVTLIPVFVVYLLMLVPYYCGRAAEEIKILFSTGLTQFYICVTNLINFVIDVPSEAVAGLLVCLCLVYVLIKFQMIVYTFLKKITQKLLIVVRAKLNQVKTAMWTNRIQIASSSAVTKETVSSSVLRRRIKTVYSEDNRLCVVCMERNKCVVSMPCRHMSTCQKCNSILELYNRNCPICRSQVLYRIHVYAE